jgi:HPt (histidine-containing phosphotransfer) domain-containing protein
MLALLRQIEGLDADSALLGLGGMWDVYEKSARLTLRLLPETLEKLDAYLSGGEIGKFAIEVHGLKGALRNIGAVALGNAGALLEDAALAKDVTACEEGYPGFKESLTTFMGRMGAVFTEGAGGEAPQVISRETFLQALYAVREAALGYDALQAREALKPLLNGTYNEKADGLVKKTQLALESFDCEGACVYINEMEEALHER